MGLEQKRPTMKPDEKKLLDTILKLRPKPTHSGLTIEQIFDLIEMNHKRGLYILDKWNRKLWWEYGVSLRCGWISDKYLLELNHLFLINAHLFLEHKEPC